MPAPIDGVHPDPSGISNNRSAIWPATMRVVGRALHVAYLASSYIAHEVNLDGAILPAGSRAIVFYRAANRDERKYPDPDRFDVRRRPGDHLGFGAGPHACVGMNLARIEMLALFTALAKRIRRFTILEAEPIVNNVLRGFKTLRVSVA
jgi:cytochrome P450